MVGFYDCPALVGIVLGGVGNFRPWLNWTNDVDLNAIGSGVVYCGDNPLHAPEQWCQVITLADGSEACQIAISWHSGRMYCRKKSTESWNEVSLDVPNFYKSYNNLSSLADALKAIW